MEINKEIRETLAKEEVIFPNLQNQSSPSALIKLAQALTYGIYGRAVDMKFADIKKAAYAAIEESTGKQGNQDRQDDLTIDQNLTFLAHAVKSFAENITKFSKEKGEKEKKSQEYTKRIADKANEITQIAIFDSNEGQWTSRKVENKPPIRTITQQIRKEQQCDIKNFQHCITQYGRTFTKEEHLNTAYFILSPPKTNKTLTTPEAPNDAQEKTTEPNNNSPSKSQPPLIPV